jgi:hypothetical protein
MRNAELQSITFSTSSAFSVINLSTSAQAASIWEFKSSFSASFYIRNSDFSVCLITISQKCEQQKNIASQCTNESVQCRSVQQQKLRHMTINLTSNKSSGHWMTNLSKFWCVSRGDALLSLNILKLQLQDRDTLLQLLVFFHETIPGIFQLHHLPGFVLITISEQKQGYAA